MDEPIASEPVEREVAVPASPDETWEALTDPLQLAEWLGEVEELELRPDGGLRIRTDDGERHGFVEEVNPPHRLVFWWRDGGGDPTRVEIELERAETEGETIVRVVESRPMLVLDGVGTDADAWLGGGATQPEMSALALVG